MHPDAREKQRAAIERKNAERGRPLTAREKLDNLARWLWDDEGVRTATDGEAGGGAASNGQRSSVQQHNRPRTGQGSI